jgi:Fe-S cluster biosynthesis and repair protein YggX
MAAARKRAAVARRNRTWLAGLDRVTRGTYVFGSQIRGPQPEGETGMADITCIRCGQMRAQLGKPPLRNELGERIFGSICQVCWDQWLKFQTALINHHGLDVRDKPAKEFLMANMEAFLFRKGETEEIDTSKQGSIQW